MATAEVGIPGQVFVNALCEAVATMAGLCPEPGGQVDENEVTFDCEEITGVMGLVGAKNGYLLITANRDSAAELVMYMTGVESSCLTENDLYDGMMELVNMVAGAVRQKMAETVWAFRLSTPWAIVSEASRIMTKRRMDGFSTWLNAGTIQLKMKIIFD